MDPERRDSADEAVVCLFVGLHPESTAFFAGRAGRRLDSWTNLPAKAKPWEGRASALIVCGGRYGVAGLDLSAAQSCARTGCRQQKAPGPWWCDHAARCVVVSKGGKGGQLSFFYCVLGHSSSARLPKHLAVMRFGGGQRCPKATSIPDPSRHREGGGGVR